MKIIESNKSGNKMKKEGKNWARERGTFIKRLIECCAIKRRRLLLERWDRGLWGTMTMCVRRFLRCARRFIASLQLLFCAMREAIKRASAMQSVKMIARRNKEKKIFWLNLSLFTLSLMYTLAHLLQSSPGLTLKMEKIQAWWENTWGQVEVFTDLLILHITIAQAMRGL